MELISAPGNIFSQSVSQNSTNEYGMVDGIFARPSTDKTVYYRTNIRACLSKDIKAGSDRDEHKFNVDEDGKQEDYD